MTVSDSEIDNYSDRDCESVGNSQSQDNMPERWVALSSVLWSPGHLAEVCTLFRVSYEPRQDGRLKYFNILTIP